MLHVLSNVPAYVLGGLLRRTWLVAAVTVIACASFAARAVAALSDAALTPADIAVHPATAPPPAPPPPRPAPALGGDAFAARNIYCSACEPAGPSAGPGGYQGQPAVLIATSLGAEPRATLRVVPTEIQGSWGLGDAIPGVGRLDEIHSTAIVVSDAAGRSRRLSLRGDAEPGAGGPPGPAPEDHGPFAGRVAKVDDTTFEVDRSLIRELVASAAKPGMGGAVPVLVNGEVRGIRLFGIGPNSPGRALELRTGDVITAFDGEPFKTAQQLIDLLARLDQISAVEIDGTRAGKPLRRTLRLR